jgi:putative protein-disulfide isomerase
MSARLLYVMDPMCSWCWGFAPVAEALVEQAQAVGGTAPGGGRFAYRQRRGIGTDHPALHPEHWQAVTEATGQPFNEARCPTVLSTTPSLPVAPSSPRAAWRRIAWKLLG